MEILHRPSVCAVAFGTPIRVCNRSLSRAALTILLETVLRTSWLRLSTWQMCHLPTSGHLLSPLTLIILPNGDGVLNAFPRQSALNPVGVIELAGQ